MSSTISRGQSTPGAVQPPPVAGEKEAVAQLPNVVTTKTPGLSAPVTDVLAKSVAVESLAPEVRSLLNSAPVEHASASAAEASAHLQSLVTEGLLNVPNTGGQLAEAFSHPALDAAPDLPAALAAPAMSTLVGLDGDDVRAELPAPTKERVKIAQELARAVETFFTKGVEHHAAISAQTPAIVVHSLRQQMEAIAPVIKRLSDQQASGAKRKDGEIEIPSADVVALERALAPPLAVVGGLAREIAAADPNELKAALADPNAKVSPEARALAKKIAPLDPHALREHAGGFAEVETSPSLSGITASMDSSQIAFLVLMMAARERKLDVADIAATVKARNAEKKLHRELRAKMRDAANELDKAMRDEFAALKKKGAIAADTKFDDYKAQRDVDPGAAEVVDGKIHFVAPTLAGPPPIAAFAPAPPPPKEPTGASSTATLTNVSVAGIMTEIRSSALDKLTVVAGSRTAAQVEAAKIHQKHPLDETERKRLAGKFGVAERDVVYLHSAYNSIPEVYRTEAGSFEDWLARPQLNSASNPSDPLWRKNAWMQGPGLTPGGGAQKDKLTSFFSFCEHLGTSLGAAIDSSAGEAVRFDDGQAWLDDNGGYIAGMPRGAVTKALDERLNLEGNSELISGLAALAELYPSVKQASLGSSLRAAVDLIRAARKREAEAAKTGDVASATAARKESEGVEKALADATKHLSPDCRALALAHFTRWYDSAAPESEVAARGAAADYVNAFARKIFETSERPTEGGGVDGAPKDFATLGAAWNDNQKGASDATAPPVVSSPKSKPALTGEVRVATGIGFRQTAGLRSTADSGEKKLTTLAGYEDAISAQQDKLDSISDLNEMDSLRLQQATDQLGKLMSTISNMMKQRSDTMGNIIGNMK